VWRNPVARQSLAEQPQERLTLEVEPPRSAEARRRRPAARGSRPSPVWWYWRIAGCALPESSIVSVNVRGPTAAWIGVIAARFACPEACRIGRSPHKIRFRRGVVGIERRPPLAPERALAVELLTFPANEETPHARPERAKVVEQNGDPA